MSGKINVVWLYPDILNLHGDRGNLMALQRIGELMGLEVSISRIESLGQPIPWEEADLLIANSGEVKNTARVAEALFHCREQLLTFAQSGGYLLATGTAGAALAQRTQRLDGSCFEGVGLLPMECSERAQVYGDDIWFTLNEQPQLPIIGNQIQVIDTTLLEGAQPLGTLIYGYGNHGAKDEGCRSGNIIFTNTLGPLLVKNPRYTQQLLLEIASSRGYSVQRQLSDEDMDYEDRSYQLIEAFIKKKMA